MVIGYDDKGLPKTKNVLAKTKAECEKKLKKLIATQKESEPQAPQQTMTVSQWLDFWYQTYKKPNLRPNTQCPINGGSTSTSFQNWVPSR